ncbi:MAG: MBL fold metallo-hydrolase [Capnocytophaga sp.]|nr:MBL fold metallo-hydrolase [Capnocytophaga sp.]
MLTIHSFTFNPFSENTYIVYSESKNAFLIDPGCFSNTENTILRDFIKEKSLKIEKILLTHAHIDHIFGLQWAFDTYKVPVYLHSEEKEILDRCPDDARRFGFEFPAFDGEVNFIKENTSIFLDDNELIIKFVPGHSPGSVAFYCPKQKFIISGDVLFYNSVGRTDLYKGSQEKLLESINSQLFTLDDETKVYCGHGKPTTIIHEKTFNPYVKNINL